MGVKVFNSPRYRWLVANKDSDPKLQQLFTDLGHHWDSYQHLAYKLDTLYLATLPPTAFDMPWDE